MALTIQERAEELRRTLPILKLLNSEKSKFTGSRTEPRPVLPKKSPAAICAAPGTAKAAGLSH